MKNLFLYLLLITSTLIARENPFAPTDAYNEEVARMMEKDEQYPIEFNNFTKKDTKYEDMNSSFKELEKKPKYKITMVPMKKEEATKEIKKVEKKKMPSTKKIVKEVSKPKVMEQIIYVKKRNDLPDVKKEYNPLSFLNITYSNNEIKIQSDKYKVFKKFNLETKQKIILDFRASDVKFYTKRKNLNTTSFKNITIGNHKNERYFRVVISLNENPSNFNVTYTNNLVSITRN